MTVKVKEEVGERRERDCDGFWVWVWFGMADDVFWGRVWVWVRIWAWVGAGIGLG